MLHVEAVSKAFGGVLAVNDVSLEVTQGEIFAVIGPNGAGKSTLFNLITGPLLPDRGRAMLGELNLVGLLPHQIIANGVARTFQRGRLFGELTAARNIDIALMLNPAYGPGLLSSFARLPSARRRERRIEARRDELMSMLGVEAVAGQRASSLSYGDARRVEIARALASDPTLLLLDEPAAGLFDRDKERLAELLCDLRAGGLTMLLIEHSMELVMRVSNEVLALDHGEVLARGRPEEVQRHPDVIAAYLGDPAVGVAEAS